MEQFSMKELYDVSLKSTYPMRIGNRTIEPGEKIAVFDKIQLANFNEIKRIIDGVVDKSKVGVCLDTCHLNDSGKDISKFDEILDEFERLIGLNYVHCVHVNDSKNIMGAKKDRHENFGYGTIGFDSLINVIYNEKLKNIPKILETPWIGEKAPYKEEIDMIKTKIFNDKLKEIE